MAKIPQSSFKTRLSLDVPRTPTTPVAQAGIVEGAQARLAQQVAGIGFDIAQKRKTAEDQDFVNNNITELGIQLQELEAREKLNNSGENLGGLTESFQTNAEEVMASFSENAPSNDAARAFQTRASQMIGRKTANLKSFEFIEKAKFRRGKIQESSGNIAFNQFQVPDTDEASLSASDHIMGIRERIGIDISSTEADILEADARIRIASGTILGLAEKGEFEKANELVQSNFLQAFDEESALKISRSLAAKQRQDFIDDIRINTQREKAAKKDFETQEDDILSDLFVRASQGEDVSKEALERIRNGEISRKQINFVDNKILTSAQKSKDENLSFQFTNRILTGEDLSAVREDVVEMVSTAQLSPEEGSKLLKSIQTRRQRAATSGIQKNKIKLANQLIKNKLPSKNPLGFPLPDQEQLQIQAMSEMDLLISRGADAMDAARAVLKKYKGQFQSLPFIPGVSVELQKDPLTNSKAIKRVIKDNLEAGRINKEEAVEQIKLLQERSDAFETEGYKSVEELSRELGSQQ